MSPAEENENPQGVWAPPSEHERRENPPNAASIILPDLWVERDGIVTGTIDWTFGRREGGPGRQAHQGGRQAAAFRSDLGGPKMRALGASAGRPSSQWSSRRGHRVRVHGAG